MQIRKRIKTVNPESEFDKSLEQELLSAWFELSELLNTGIRFSDNFDANILTSSDTGAANTEFSLTHTLKRVPTGFIVINNNKAGVVYDSGTAWTVTTIYLKCDVANCNIKVLVF